MVKHGPSHPWRSSVRNRVKSECVVCKTVFERSALGDKKCCSLDCEKERKKVSWLMSRRKR